MLDRGKHNEPLYPDGVDVCQSSTFGDIRGILEFLILRLDNEIDDDDDLISSPNSKANIPITKGNVT